MSQLGDQPTASPGAAGSVTESYVGTIDYMAPEVRSGRGADRRSDLYAVGVMAYTLLTGEKPLGMAKPASQLVKGLDRRWDRILGCCLEPRPENRYRDAPEMLREVERLGTSKGPPAALVVGMGVLLAVGIAVGSWMYFNRADTGEQGIPAVAVEGAVARADPKPFDPRKHAQAKQPVIAGSVTAEAEAAPAVFVLRVDPREADARLWIPGSRFTNYAITGGETRLEGLQAGDYEIVVQARGYERYSARLTIDAEGGEEVVRLAPVKGSLEVRADPDTEVTSVAADTGERMALGSTDPNGVLRVDNVLRIGTYSLELKKPHHRDQRVEPVVLVLGRTVTVTEDLLPLPGELSVFTVPQGAEVRLNGEVAGKSSTTIEQVPAEEASVFLKGYRRLERTVTLSAAESRMLDFGTLTAAAGDIRLRFAQSRVLDGRLSVEVDGRMLGKHAIAITSDGSVLLEGIEPGSRSVRLTHPDYEQWEGAVSVRDQEITELEAKLSPKPGILTVSTRPSVGFDLEVDGTPVNGREGKYSLPAEAAHTVTLRAEGYKVATKTLTLPPNGRESWTVALERAVGPEDGRPWLVPDLRDIQDQVATIDSTPAAGRVHVVRANDTLASIANRYVTAVWEIKALNGLGNDRIAVGQRLRLPDLKIEFGPKNWEAEMESSEMVSRESFSPETGRDFALRLSDEVNLEMAWIEPGAFLMGSPTGESDRDKDELQHQVRLMRGYWLGRYEVTQREWQSTMGTSAKQQRDKRDSKFSMAGEGDRHPIYYVNWEEAMEFCRKFTARERAAGRLAADREYTLPTEAQWEYACRAGTTTPFHYGESLSSAQANFDGEDPYGGASKGQYLEKTVAVGTYRPNAWGLYDMHGNVWEWCSDWYGDYLRDAVGDPTGPVSGLSRVNRGGGWLFSAGYFRSGNRNTNPSAIRGSNLGFRLALVSLKVVADLPASPSQWATRQYVVQQGDSLWGIARSHQRELGELLELNPTARNTTLHVGQSIVVRDPKNAEDQIPAIDVTPSAGRFHVVRAQDTLTSIANRYVTTVGKIRTLNGLVSDIIEVGQRLKLPDLKIDFGPENREMDRESSEIVSHESFFPETGSDFALRLSDDVNLEMAWIAPGAFLMGSPAGEAKRDNDETPHRVTLTRGYWLGRYEVTQREWQSIMGSSVKQQRDKADTERPMRGEGDKHPIYYVNWEEAMDFCRKLTQRERAAGRLSAIFEYTLPTEAQWEYACRAGTTTPFHFGESLSSAQANFDGKDPYGGASKGQYLQKTVAVGTYRPNAWGLYDMHGNVWEWFSDWYGDYLGNAVSEPTGPGWGLIRVIRGGGWFRPARDCRSASRLGYFLPGLRSRSLYLGFRLALRSAGK